MWTIRKSRLFSSVHSHYLTKYAECFLGKLRAPNQGIPEFLDKKRSNANDSPIHLETSKGTKDFSTSEGW